MSKGAGDWEVLSKVQAAKEIVGLEVGEPKLSDIHRAT